MNPRNMAARGNALVAATRAALLLFAAGCLLEGRVWAGGNEWDLTTPTEWSWHHNVAADQLTSLMVSRNERLVELEVVTPSPLRFTAATVKNTGAHAKASWWYPQLTAAQVSDKLAEHSARLVDIEAYDLLSGPGEAIFYAVVLVPNTGADTKGWAWYPSATSTFIGQKLEDFGARLIDLDAFTVNGQRRYAAIMIGNTGADQKNWGWVVNQPWSTIDESLQGSRLLDVIHEGDGLYTAVFESCPCEGWWVMFSTSEAAVRARAAQLGARIIDLEHYWVASGWFVSPRFVAVMVDNLSAESRRISNLLAEVPGARNYGIYAKRVGGSVLAALQEDFVHEPLSSIKVTAHLEAMRQVESGSIGLDDTIAAYEGSGLPDEACYLPDGQQKPVSDVLQDMMQSSSNPDWAATVNHFGKDAIESLLASIGMTRTEIRRVGCAPLLNRWTLRDAGRLYEGVANGTLLSDERANFYALMPGKPGGANTLVDEEAPPQMTAQQKQAFKNLFAISRKDGSWTQSAANGEISAESAVTRIGVARIPGCIGATQVTRSHVYGVFQNGPVNSAAQIGTATDKAALELLRQPIRTALSQWANCAASAAP